MDREIVDIIDDAGKVLRQAAKTEAHKHGWLHKTVIGYLKYGEAWVLVCQAAKNPYRLQDLPRRT